MAMMYVQLLQVTLVSPAITVHSSLEAFLNHVRSEDDLFFTINGVPCTSLLIQSNTSTRRLQIPPKKSPIGVRFRVQALHIASEDRLNAPVLGLRSRSPAAARPQGARIL